MNRAADRGRGDHQPFAVSLAVARLSLAASGAASGETIAQDALMRATPIRTLTVPVSPSPDGSDNDY
jgi:hypothetical protein